MNLTFIVIWVIGLIVIYNKSVNSSTSIIENKEIPTPGVGQSREEKEKENEDIVQGINNFLLILSVIGTIVCFKIAPFPESLFGLLGLTFQFLIYFIIRIFISISKNLRELNQKLSADTKKADTRDS